MSGKTDKVIACLKEINFKPKIDDFQTRIIIQKTVYLLDKKGLNFGFPFGIFIHGPYSQSLTVEYYNNKADFERLATKSSLTRKEKGMVDEFNQIFDMTFSLLEIAATYAYFIIDQGQDETAAIRNLKKIKPYFSETQVALGISKAKEFLFEPSKEDIFELKKELSAWQSASVEDLSKDGG